MLNSLMVTADEMNTFCKNTSVKHLSCCVVMLAVSFQQLPRRPPVTMSRLLRVERQVDKARMHPKQLCLEDGSLTLVRGFKSKTWIIG